MGTIFNTIRGTKDIFGSTLALHKHIVKVAMEYAKCYCYQEIATPIFEESVVFHRTLGDTSDMISKETYTFLDRDKTNITLRPEFTAAIVRAFLSNAMTQDIPIKLFSYGPLFRHERPQHGRYRQFHQISFEYLGSLSPLTDVEIIAMASDFMKVLNIAEVVEIEINTLGNKEDRALYRNALVEYFSKYKNELSAESIRRLEKNPLRILDSKDENDRKIVQTCPLISDYLSPDSKNRYEQVKENLSSLGIQYIVNEKLVRGMDYYTHTVFEFTTKQLGAQGTVLAGGRYDGLIELMGGPSIPAIGFAAGVERLAELYGQYNAPPSISPSFHIIPIGDAAEQYSLVLARSLRSQGLIINIEYDKTLKKRMHQANKTAAHGVILIGEDELKHKKCKFKDMKSGREEEIALESLAEYLLSIK